MGYQHIMLSPDEPKRITFHLPVDQLAFQFEFEPVKINVVIDS